MARAPRTADRPSAIYEADAKYRVTISKPIMLGGVLVRPSEVTDLVLSGAICEQHRDKIASASKV